ncbi:TonB-dependent receptor [Oceanicoccus sp. KOV_DT_Chl]|uniref:TonB-dependent receptor n=1 Tax=Oceanicoccus sp. KOV_DT_Chl TaxID=1904639 RepID=UPI00135AF605|nr:TonB-dependent receptor [Oceanicoccus sp. KOV_DT_Chl]
MKSSAIKGFVLLTAASHLYAASNTIEQLTVKGTRSEQPSIELPASIKIISSEEITISGANTIADVLRSQPGIQVSDVIGAGNRGVTISMRGMTSNAANNVLILVDGRKLNNASLASPDLSSVSLNNVERIEIIEGSAGALYGDQSTGGVINIISKRPAKEQQIQLEASSGSNDREEFSGSISQGFDNGLSYRVAAKNSNSDNYRDHNESKYDNYFGLLTYKTDNLSVFIEGQNIYDKMNLAGALDLAQVREDRKQAASPGFDDRKSDIFRTGGQYQINQSWSIAGEYTYRDTDAITSYSVFSERLTSINPRLLGEIASANGTTLITLGVDSSESTYLSAGSYGKSNEQDIFDVYGQIIYPITTKIKVTAAYRNSELDDSNKTTSESHSDDQSAGQLGVSYQANKALRLFARLDQSFRWPNADENGLVLTGIEFLKPQTSNSFEIGFDLDRNDLRLSTVIYDLDIDDELFYNPSLYANMNLESSNRRGITIDGNYYLSDRLTLSANFSYIDAELSAGLFSGNDVPFVADTLAGFAVSYQFSSNLSLFIDGKYTGERYPIGDEANSTDKLGGYTVYNANIRWAQDDWYTNLRANNLSGKDYNGYTGTYDAGGPVFYVYPAATAEFEITIGYTF